MHTKGIMYDIRLPRANNRGHGLQARMPRLPDSRYATPTNSSYNMYTCVYGLDY